MQIRVGSITASLAAPRRGSMLRVPLLLALALACTGIAMSSATFAQPPQPSMSRSTATTAPLPEWDRLSAEQRALLIAPMRQRWNDSPDRRGDMYQHAQRWQSMTPEQRSNARNGKKRFDRMDPAQRAEARVLFERMQALPPDQRRALREQWKAMTPDQRREWVRSNAAP